MRLAWAATILLACLGAPASAAGAGRWGPTFPLPVIPVAVAVLHTNELLMWSAYLKDGNQIHDDITKFAYTQTATMNLATKAVSARTITNTQHDMFCPGLAMMADGRVHVVGGATGPAYSIYDPTARQWIKGTRLNYGRGYSGDVTLSDGRVVAFGGGWNGDKVKSKIAEVWSPSTGKWTALPKVTTNDVLTNSADPRYVDNYRWMFAMENGNFFNAGPANDMKFFTTAGQGSQINAGVRGGADQDEYSHAVMYEPGKIAVVAAYQQDAFTIGKYHSASIIEMADQGRTLKTPKVLSWEKGNLPQRMIFPRAYANAVLLPTGDIIYFGGQKIPRTYTDTEAIKTPELWNHVTRTFTLLPACPTPRTYHSVAVLLPDGTVFSGGGGLCNRNAQIDCPPNAVNHLSGEFYYPGYLFNQDGSRAVRPQIKVAPVVANHGAVIKVTTDVAVKSFVLIRTSATTHGSNNDQRRIPLPIVGTSGLTYSLQIPFSKGVVIAGYHMLFAFNGQGTPSVAKFVRIALN